MTVIDPKWLKMNPFILSNILQTRNQWWYHVYFIRFLYYLKCRQTFYSSKAPAEVVLEPSQPKVILSLQLLVNMLILFLFPMLFIQATVNAIDKTTELLQVSEILRFFACKVFCCCDTIHVYIYMIEFLARRIKVKQFFIN